MELLEHIYNDVLKSLHFSITGHSQFDDDLYDFYDRLAESALFKQNHNIRFLIGSICELKDHNKWEVESYKQIYFKSFFTIDKISFLSFYFFSIRKLSETFLDGKHINVSKIIAGSFNRQINIRVSLTEYTKPFCKFDDRIFVFEVKIPYKIFKQEILNELPELRDKLHDAIKTIDDDKKAKQSKAKTQKGKEKSRYYSFDSVTDDTKYQSFYDKLIENKKVTSVFNELSSMLEKRFSAIISNSSGTNHKELATSCIGIAMMCLYFNTSLEYFTGIAKVQRTGFRKIEHRNLGGIVIGYRKDYPLSKSERVLFGIIADKITSVIAGQILVDELEEKRAKLKGN